VLSAHPNGGGRQNTVDPDIACKLLLGIARLGEADMFGWWRSRGLTEAGEYVLGGTLPRTWYWSALEGDVLSAAARHQEVLGRATAIHLFSDLLAVKARAMGWLREQKVIGNTDGFLSHIRGWDQEVACREIAEWAAIKPPKGEILAEGHRIGRLSEEDLKEPDRWEGAVRMLAAAYVDRPHDLRFPYFNLV